jgi:phage FluMu protein Com
MYFDWTTIFVVVLICAGIGAAITSAKERGPWEGLALGGLLGIIGVVIAACLSKGTPLAPSGMVAVKCPRCNAVQNVTEGQPHYECWQCHTASPAPGFENAVPPGTRQQSGSPRNVKCYRCNGEHEVLPTAATSKCPNCQTTLKLTGRPAE